MNIKKLQLKNLLNKLFEQKESKGLHVYNEKNSFNSILSSLIFKQEHTQIFRTKHSKPVLYSLTTLNMLQLKDRTKNVYETGKTSETSVFNKNNTYRFSYKSSLLKNQDSKSYKINKNKVIGMGHLLTNNRVLSFDKLQLNKKKLYSLHFYQFLFSKKTNQIKKNYIQYNNAIKLPKRSNIHKTDILKDKPELSVKHNYRAITKKRLNENLKRTNLNVEFTFKSKHKTSKSINDNKNTKLKLTNYKISKQVNYIKEEKILGIKTKETKKHKIISKQINNLQNQNPVFSTNIVYDLNILKRDEQQGFKSRTKDIKNIKPINTQVFKHLEVKTILNTNNVKVNKTYVKYPDLKNTKNFKHYAKKTHMNIYTQFSQGNNSSVISKSRETGGKTKNIENFASQPVQQEYIVNTFIKINENQKKGRLTDKTDKIFNFKEIKRNSKKTEVIKDKNHHTKLEYENKISDEEMQVIDKISKKQDIFIKQTNNSSKSLQNRSDTFQDENIKQDFNNINVDYHNKSDNNLSGENTYITNARENYKGQDFKNIQIKKLINMKILIKETMLKATLINNRFNVTITSENKNIFNMKNEIEGIISEAGFNEFKVEFKDKREKTYKKNIYREINVKV